MNVPFAAAPAGLPRRLAAGVYDLFPLAALWMLGAALWLALSGGGPVAPGNPFFRAYLLAIAFAYYGVSWRRGGQTVGMRAWRIRVMTADGRPLAWSATALRFAVAVLGIACFGAGLWWSLLDPDKRMWHDLAAGTRVERK
jgi:uncharacterized RDD family membrane protein YckC